MTKRVLKQDDPCVGLMVYRDTVIAATACSPVQLMVGHHIRTTLQTLSTALRSRWPNLDLVLQRDFETKLSYQRNYARHQEVRPLPQLSPGDIVRVRTDSENKGVITNRADTPRSRLNLAFIVEIGILKSYRCHQSNCPVFLSVSLN